MYHNLMKSNLSSEIELGGILKLVDRIATTKEGARGPWAAFHQASLHHHTTTQMWTWSGAFVRGKTNTLNTLGAPLPSKTFWNHSLHIALLSAQATGIPPHDAVARWNSWHALQDNPSTLAWWAQMSWRSQSLNHTMLKSSNEFNQE